MSTDLVPLDNPDPGCSLAVPEPPGLPKIEVTSANIYAAFLAEATKETTRQAREWDLDDFARFMIMPPAIACTVLISRKKGEAVAIAKAYQAYQVARGKAAATTNRRLSTIRSLVRLAGELELVTWVLTLKNLKDTPYRDTRGPGHSGWVKVLEQARKRAAESDVGRRDLAILRLLHDNLLRREEVVTLDLADLDLDAGRLEVLRKGHHQKVSKTLNTPTLLAILKWLDVRGDSPGPLFTRMDRARDKTQLQRIDGDSLRKLTLKLGVKAGLTRRVRPHGLRHEGVTRILELTGGNVEMAQAAAGHANPATTMKYNDQRKDVAGEAARLLGDDA